MRKNFESHKSFFRARYPYGGPQVMFASGFKAREDHLTSILLHLIPWSEKILGSQHGRPTPLTTGIEIQTEELYLPGPASVIILTNATD